MIPDQLEVDSARERLLSKKKDPNLESNWRILEGNWRGESDDYSTVRCIIQVSGTYEEVVEYALTLPDFYAYGTVGSIEPLGHIHDVRFLMSREAQDLRTRLEEIRLRLEEIEAKAKAEKMEADLIKLKLGLL